MSAHAIRQINTHGVGRDSQAHRNGWAGCWHWECSCGAKSAWPMWYYPIQTDAARTRSEQHAAQHANRND